jgi:hypothetical protein
MINIQFSHSVLRPHAVLIPMQFLLKAGSNYSRAPAFSSTEMIDVSENATESDERCEGDE